MALVTRLELRQEIRGITDATAATLALEAAHHITDTFLNQRINAHGARLFRKIQRARGDFVIRTHSEATADGKEYYAMPDDFLSLLRVRAYDGTNYYDMDRFQFGPEDAALKQWESTGGSSSHAGVYRYHLVSHTHGAKALWIQPTPQVATHTIQVVYAPNFVRLEADGETLDGFDGWEQYVVYAVAIDVMAKRDRDPSPFMMAFAAMDSELDDAIVALDLARPERVRDTMQDDGSAYPNVWPSYYSDV